MSGGGLIAGERGWKETLLGTMGTMQGADDALLSCTCVVWQTGVAPIHSIKQTKSPRRFGVAHTLVGLLAQLLADFVALAYYLHSEPIVSSFGKSSRMPPLCATLSK